MITHKINLTDKGQDLVTIGASCDEVGVGEIQEVNIGAKSFEYLIGMAVDLRDIPQGAKFQYAVPFNGFQVQETTFEIESVETVS